MAMGCRCMHMLANVTGFSNLVFKKNLTHGIQTLCTAPVCGVGGMETYCIEDGCFRFQGQELRLNSNLSQFQTFLFAHRAYYVWCCPSVSICLSEDTCFCIMSPNLIDIIWNLECCFPIGLSGCFLMRVTISRRWPHDVISELSLVSDFLLNACLWLFGSFETINYIIFHETVSCSHWRTLPHHMRVLFPYHVKWLVCMRSRISFISLVFCSYIFLGYDTDASLYWYLQRCMYELSQWQLCKNFSDSCVLHEAACIYLRPTVHWLWKYTVLLNTLPPLHPLSPHQTHPTTQNKFCECHIWIWFCQTALWFFKCYCDGWKIGLIRSLFHVSPQKWYHCIHYTVLGQYAWICMASFLLYTASACQDTSAEWINPSKV